MPADALSSAPSAPSATMAPGPVGALRLLAAFRHEQSDPGSFYGLLARDSVALVARHVQLRGSRVVDVGGGAGYFTDAFRAHGARCLLVEPDPAELYSRGDPGHQSVLGDGYWLPLPDASIDVCFSCNVLEHVRDPAGLIDEMIRVTRPGGLVYLAYTVWLGPWGGHESAPFHYLGATTRCAVTSAVTAGSRRTSTGRRCSRSASGRSCPSCGGAPTSPWSRHDRATTRPGAGSSSPCQACASC